MDGKVIHDVDVGATLRCQDQRRFWSAEVTRAFTSVIRAASLGSQSEVAEQHEVTIEPDVAISDMAIVRGVD
jgi:hypothetical protein